MAMGDSQSKSRAGHQSHGGAAGTSEDDQVREYYAMLKERVEIQKHVRLILQEAEEERRPNLESAVANLSQSQASLWTVLSPHLQNCLDKVNTGIPTIAAMNMPTSDQEWESLDKLIRSLSPTPVVVRRSFCDLAVKAATTAVAPKTGAEAGCSKYVGKEVEFNGAKHLDGGDVKDLKPLNDRVLIKGIAVGLGTLDEEVNRKPLSISEGSTVL